MNWFAVVWRLWKTEKLRLIIIQWGKKKTHDNESESGISLIKKIK